MRGGKRIGAGRPVGTKKEPTIVYYRRIKPEWEEILDKILEELKNERGKNMKNNWFVANDNGDIIGHDLDKAKAKILASEMAEKEPNAGWEALNSDED